MAKRDLIEVVHSCGHTRAYSPRLVVPSGVRPCPICAQRQMSIEAASETTIPVVVAPVVESPLRPLTHTAAGMVIDALERGVDVEARFAAWNEDELSEDEDW